MPGPESTRLARGLALALLLVQVTAGPAAAQVLDPRAVFESGGTRAEAPSAEAILSRALDNLYGFDAMISLQIERRSAAGEVARSEFLVQRRRFRDARRLLVVSILPEAMLGNRVLEVDHDDGSEETYAFVPGRGEPVRSPYRVAEPFLATWYQIGADEPAQQTRAVADYEILGFTPASTVDEEASVLSLQPIVPRGYDRLELVIASSDATILEQRQYRRGATTPTLIATTARADLVRFGDRLLPGRIRYRDPGRDVSFDVVLRHMPLAEGSDLLFLPATFHRVPLPQVPGATPAGPPPPAGG
jgi:hypothetical protein